MGPQVAVNLLSYSYLAGTAGVARFSGAHRLRKRVEAPRKKVVRVILGTLKLRPRRSPLEKGRFWWAGREVWPHPSSTLLALRGQQVVLRRGQHLHATENGEWLIDIWRAVCTKNNVDVVKLIFGPRQWAGKV